MLSFVNNKRKYAKSLIFKKLIEGYYDSGIIFHIKNFRNHWKYYGNRIRLAYPGWESKAQG
jgi:hypothetical protein